MFIYSNRKSSSYLYFQKDPNAMAQMKAPLFEEKVVDHIIENAKVTEKKVTSEEMIAIIEAEDDEVAAKKPAKEEPAKSG